jgi:hypothetical protein
MISNNDQFLMYETEDGQTKIEVRMEEDTVWLSLNQLAELFQRDKSVISRHMKNIFVEGELNEQAVVANYATTAADGKIYDVRYYNLDVIISVGYRVKSLRGTQFRIWATQRLKEYIIKGFTMNDDLLKRAGGGNYFKELLARIRDIRSSEKVFYRQVLDIYATSIDYNSNAEMTKNFFQTVQNKMHFAAHGHTAAELVFLRADGKAKQMGMMAFIGDKPKKKDITVAKNYLKEDELNILNRLVSAYLEFAEIQAIRQKPMYMKDWVAKLDDFIKMSGSELLVNAGTISHEQAKVKAELEYEKYHVKHKDDLSQVEQDFIRSLSEAQKKLTGKGGGK